MNLKEMIDFAYKVLNDRVLSRDDLKVAVVRAILDKMKEQRDISLSPDMLAEWIRIHVGLTGAEALGLPALIIEMLSENILYPVGDDNHVTLHDAFKTVWIEQNALKDMGKDVNATRPSGQVLIDEVTSSNTDITVGVQALVVRRLMEVGFAVPEQGVLAFFAFPDMLEPPASVTIANMIEDRVLVKTPGGLWLHPEFKEGLDISIVDHQRPKKVLEASITVCGLVMTYKEAIDLVDVMEKFFMMTPFGIGDLDLHSKEFNMTYRGVVFDRKIAMQLGDEIRRNHVFVGSSFPAPARRGLQRSPGTYYSHAELEKSLMESTRGQRDFRRTEDRFQRSRDVLFDQRDPNMTHTYGVHEGRTAGPKF